MKYHFFHKCLWLLSQSPPHPVPPTPTHPQLLLLQPTSYYYHSIFLHLTFSAGGKPLTLTNSTYFCLITTLFERNQLCNTSLLWTFIPGGFVALPVRGICHFFTAEPAETFVHFRLVAPSHDGISSSFLSPPATPSLTLILVASSTPRPASIRIAQPRLRVYGCYSHKPGSQASTLSTYRIYHGIGERCHGST